MQPHEIETWVKIAGGAAAAAAALVAAFRGISEWRRANAQREEELKLKQREFRHKQALMARDLVKEIFGDKSSRAALDMLDWWQGNYQDGAGRNHFINRDRIRAEMRIDSPPHDETGKIIRGCFDSLLTYLEQLERMIRLEVVQFGDVETAFRYHMVSLHRSSLGHREFCETYDYPEAARFFARFEAYSARAGDFTLQRVQVPAGEREKGSGTGEAVSFSPDGSPGPLK